ncbi:MAG: hypothetical protein ACI93R_000897 [Flavobacteriales bacterium]|jgi:hypothetical protein
MIFQQSFKKLYVALMTFVMTIFATTAFIEVTVMNDVPISVYISKFDVWAPLLIKPLAILIITPLLGAFIIQRGYKSTLNGEELDCRNSLGKQVKIKMSDIRDMKTYNIPVIPVVKIKIESMFWSIWVSKDATDHISTLK